MADLPVGGIIRNRRLPAPKAPRPDGLAAPARVQLLRHTAHPRLELTPPPLACSVARRSRAMPAASAVSTLSFGRSFGGACEKPDPSLPALSSESSNCELERFDSAEPLSPPASSHAQTVQPASPAQPAEGSHEASSQSSPMDADDDECEMDDGRTAKPQPLSAQTSSSTDRADIATAADGPPLVLPPPASYKRVALKGQGLGEDEIRRANDEVRAAIAALSCLLDGHPMLEMRVAETEVELLDALKLYRDMNHLSLTGVTCEQVVEHMLSHTVNLYYRPELDAAPIAVTAATFTMRQNTMMLRLLATHPRMTRKGFGRVTVHFLKELCRALHKSDILVYTYPSSSPFYKAMHFRHTHAGEAPKPQVAGAGADEAAREAARDARRAFSAKENEMIFIVQPTMQQILARACRAASETVAHPYACTRKRASAGNLPALADESVAAAPTAAAPSAAAGGRARRGGGVSKRGASEVEADAAAPAPAVGKRSASGAGSASKRQQQQQQQQHAGATPAAPPAPPPAPPPAAAAAEAWKAAVAPLFQPGHANRTVRGARQAAAAELPAAPPPAESPTAPSSAEPAAEPVSAAAAAAKAILASVRAEATELAAAESEDGETAEPSKRKRKRVKAKDVYQVERIVDVQKSSTDPEDVRYLIKWKGWAAKYNTWEPVEHLGNLQAEIEAFERRQHA
mmetsp:Transcript_989/g.2721  ORF Transcript_989/g.2721 Transcript_989/m.2721 type:complete len:686 (+) Transcript_989:240-2297(+)